MFKMPLSAAEKQRRYRQRLNDKDSESAKEKERKRWHSRREQGKVKTFRDMTPREQRAERKKWMALSAKRVNERRLAKEAREHE